LRGDLELGPAELLDLEAVRVALAAAALRREVDVGVAEVRRARDLERRVEAAERRHRRRALGDLAALRVLDRVRERADLAGQAHDVTALAVVDAAQPA